MSRPSKPMGPIRVVQASSVLTDAQKALWVAIYWLDGPEGCYLRPAGLASRLGWDITKLERVRPVLKGYGILYSQPRKGYTDAWRTTLPSECIPEKRDPDMRKEADWLPYVERLDDHLRRCQPTPKSEGRFPPTLTLNSEGRLTETTPQDCGEDADNLPTKVRQPPHKSEGSYSVLSNIDKKSVLSAEKDETARTENDASRDGGTRELPTEWREAKERLRPSPESEEAA